MFQVQKVCQNTRRQLFNIVRQCSTEYEKPMTSEKCMNSVTLLGRVGKTPELRTSMENKPFVTFSLATNELIGSKQSEELSVKTEWHTISIFKPNLVPNVAENVNKGMRVLVQGKITYRTIQDAEGNEKKVTSIIAHDLVRLSPRGQ